jgi:hypothetical protein
MAKTTHSIRQTCISVMNDPNATPKDRLAASLQLGRLKKGKARGLSAKKEPLVSAPLVQEPIEPKPTSELSPAERIQRAIGSSEERAKFAEEYEANKRARIEMLNAMELSPAESAGRRAQENIREDDARLRYLEQVLYERLPEDEKQDFHRYFWYSPAERAHAEAAYKAAIESGRNG